MEHWWLVYNLLFLGKVDGKVVWLQFQRILKKKTQIIWIPSNCNSGSPLLGMYPSMYQQHLILLIMISFWPYARTVNHRYYSTLVLLFPKPIASISALEGRKVEAFHPSIWGASQLSLFSRVVLHQQKLLWEIIHQFRVSCHQYADEIQLYICTPGQARDGNRSLCPSA